MSDLRIWKFASFLTRLPPKWRRSAQFLSSRRLSEPSRENSSAASGPITHELFLGMRPSSLLHRKLLVAAVQHALDQYNLKRQAETPQSALFSAVNQLALLLQHIICCVNHERYMYQYRSVRTQPTKKRRPERSPYIT